MASGTFRPMDENAVRERAERGGGERYEEFVREYTGAYRGLYSFILTLVAEPNRADDLMQETGLLLWQKFDDFAPGTNFLRWGKAVAHNLVRNFQRHQQRHRFLAFDEELMAKLARTHQAAEELLAVRRTALHACMEKLALAEQKLLRVCYAEHETIADAAANLNQQPNALYKRLRRIRLKLSRCVERRLGLDR